MRPKIAVWSDYASPRQKRWRSRYRRGPRSSIGFKILLVAGVSVAGVVGISGIYPQIIDSEWMRNAGTHAKRAAAEATTPRRPGSVTAIPLSPHQVATTTGEAAAPRPAPAAPAVSAPRPAAAPAAAEPPKVQSFVAAAELLPDEAVPPADIPQAVDDQPAKPAPGATPAVRRYVARAPVVKRRVVRTEHHRGYSGAYAQYGWGGGWSWPGLSSPYHF